ncbi:MAG: hypothetical protein ACYTFM_07340, partial [Planctomycetota bacterium]
MEMILLQILPSWQTTIIGVIVGVGLALIGFQIYMRARSKNFKEDLKRQLDGAKKESENIIKAAQVDATAETLKLK